ncbi:MFS transporter [Pseudomonas putida]|uniref:MFS transporter n=1 Tax=Pseudomonas putida TaxID=303 RepID=UPI00186593F4|nr:MFS transporter [Pseudomonas putida]
MNEQSNISNAGRSGDLLYHAPSLGMEHPVKGVGESVIDSESNWKLLGLWLIVVLIVSCPAFGAAVINTHMATALNLDRAVLGAGFGLASATMGGTAPFLAIAFRRFGIRNVMLAGAAMAAISAVLMCTVVTTGPAFIICYGLLMGLGVGAAGILPTQTIVSIWFRGRRALAVSVVMSAGEFAGIVMPPFFAWLITSTGTWRSGWWVALGCIVIGACLVYWIVPKNLSMNKKELDVGPGESADDNRTSRVYKTPVPWVVADAMRTRQFLIIVLFGIANSLGWIFFLAHGVEHMQDLAYGSTIAASAISIIVASSFFGTMCAGLLGDKVPPHILATLALLIVSTGLFLAMSPSGLTAMVLFAVIFGFGYGAGQVCGITMMMNYFGAKPFPALLGISIAVSTITSAIWSTAAGAIYDQLHSYTPSFIFVVGLTSCVALLQLFASPRSIRRERVQQ